MPDIHPTAVVHDGAVVADDAVIGPYSVIGPRVTLGSGTVIDHHVSVMGRTTMGSGNRVHPFASIGGPPQDLKYKGEDTALVIGDRNTIREFVTLNLATASGSGVTSIGSDCLFMAYVHVAHDCVVGNGVIMANCATLAGHVHIDDRAIIGGLTAIHQFCRIGRSTMIGGCSAIVKDVVPFSLVSGNRAYVHGLNLVGLRRQGFTATDVGHLKHAFRIIFRSRLMQREALETVAREIPATPAITHLLEFVQGSKRGLTTAPRTGGSEEDAAAS
jgi:UDP-N-acetylglucosamine acyltransferase